MAKKSNRKSDVKKQNNTDTSKTSKTTKASGKKAQDDNLVYFDGTEDEDDDYFEDSIYRRKRLLIVESILLLFLFIIYVVLIEYTVTNVYVEGNEHYDAAEIRKIVENNWFGDNSLFLSLKYKDRSITNVPFVEKMDVDVINRNTIRITVYEKKMAGYVEYLGHYEYFDKDGVVVESSNIRTEGVPLVTGLTFDHFVMYEPLPVADPSVFQLVLNITNLLNKYNITTDKIYFDKNKEVTLYFGDIRVGLGSDMLLEEKIQRLDAILPNLEGKKGYLEMGSYDKGNEDFTFTND